MEGCICGGWENIRVPFTKLQKPKKVESLWIPKSFCFEDDHVNHSKVLKRMQSLQVLILENEDICWESTVTCLPSSLRWIEWTNYPFSSLPEGFDPSHLVGLCLRRSRLVELWPIRKKLSNLKHLDLSESFGLTKTPNFGDMPNLETLILRSCSNLEEVHPSLGHCRMLTNLILYGCVKLKKLPKFVTMESLETLNLDEYTSFEEFPEICGNMRRLSTLSVGSPRIRSLLPSLIGLRYLLLRDCEVLESIPDAIQNLESLYIEGCNKLATLPNSLFESHEKLKILDICQCSGLVELPISLGVQKRLWHLRIVGCDNLKKLPSSIHMESLKLLQISNCPKLDTFPEINGDMHCLEKLTLNSTGIRELPSSIGNLSGLIELNLKGCEDLVSLPNSLCNLMNLRRLILRGCKKLEKLPENIGDLQELESLDATETAISQPPPSITKLGKLQELRFSHVLQHVQHSLTSAFHQLSALSSLRELDLSNLNILGGLPEDLGSLLFLEELNVSGSNISCLPKNINKLLHLRQLNVQLCQNLNELPGDQLPPNLEKLYIDYHLALKSIRDLVTKYCLKLRVLSISRCGHEKSEYGTVSTCQVNVLKSLQHLIRRYIQCDFQQRDYFVISFPKVRIPKLFDYQFVNQKGILIDLNPSWYTNKFMDFSIFCYPYRWYLSLVATLVCKTDPERKHSVKYNTWVRQSQLSSANMCYIYIPFETLWLASGNKEGKNPNDYYLFEVSEVYGKELCWGIRLEYENKDRRWRRKQRATLSSELFPVPLKDTSVTTKSDCSIALEQPEPSLPSSSRASAEHDIATDRGLYLGYEKKAAMAILKKHKSQNVELISVCGSTSWKMDDASRKRKRKRN